MLKIFAKHNTSEKALVCCAQNEVRMVQLFLAKKYGGSWIFVDKIQSSQGEFLKFDDGETYRVFDGDRRYSKAIEIR